MRRRRHAIIACLAISATIGGAQGVPQKPGQAPFRSGANFVRVDVYPTAGGVPVLDLRAEDFEVLEDNAAQAIQTFEHIVVRPAGPQETRAEPTSVGQSLQMAADPRTRVFVLFLDKKHVNVGSSWNARQPLIRLVDRILGPDDLMGVMTSDMAASDITLARKTQILADGLMSLWPWGERFTLQEDEREKQYWECFPLPEQAGILAEMKARRRERMTLDALRELVLYLANIREERKAILTVSEGWLLYRPNSQLTKPVGNEPVPGPQGIGTGPDGRITLGRDPRNSNMGATRNDCWADRTRLAMMDNEVYFRQIIGEANRGNSSFYTVDPRGLAVFDTPINAGVSITADFGMLRNRQNTLHTLAEATDGLAVMDTNDLDAGFKRIADDLSSYYLLGYNSTNTKLDGKYRSIKVRVKRPGVDVRARKGYQAATEEEVARARTAAAPPLPEIVTTMSSAMGTLDRVRPGLKFYINAVPLASAEKSVSTIWVAGELQSSGAADPWLKGGAADVEVTSQGSSVTAHVALAPGDRGFVVPVVLARAVDSGTVEVRVRMSGTDPAAERAIDSLILDVGSARGRPLLFRRGPTTGNRLQPAATFHFSRTERARLEVPLSTDVKPGAGRILDKSGQQLTVPVIIGERTDQPSGQRWLTADITLAALAPGDYAVELTAAGPGGEQRVVSAIRVGR